MSRRYRVPAAPVRVEDRVEHSRFIADVSFADTIDAARTFIDRVRAEFPDASHHCYAFVVGPAGSTASMGSSDAGEPSGTAGRPMLTVLLASGVGDVVAVVTRYFGGVKLGKGGLVRAYSGALQHALRELATREHEDLVTVTVRVAYAHVDAVQRAVAREGARIDGDRFEDVVTLSIVVAVDRVESLDRALQDATAGAVRLEH